MDEQRHMTMDLAEERDPVSEPEAGQDPVVEPEAEQDAAATAAGHARSSRRPRKRTALVVAGVVLLAGVFTGGAATGAALSDPTASEEFASLSAYNDSLLAQRTRADEDYSALQQDHEELSSGIADRESEVTDGEAANAERSQKLDETEAALAKREKAVTGAEEEKEANTVSNGTWTVGLDIAPGTYRSDDAVDSDCYWAVLRTGSNGDIVDNDIPGGGRPSVTLAKGQDFETNRCGTWSKR